MTIRMLLGIAVSILMLVTLVLVGVALQRLLGVRTRVSFGPVQKWGVNRSAEEDEVLAELDRTLGAESGPTFSGAPLTEAERALERALFADRSFRNAAFRAGMRRVTK